MDPATAVGMASGILSFITFSSKVVSGAIKIHESLDGTLDDDRSRTAVAKEIKSLVAQLSPLSDSDLPDEEDGLSVLAKQCDVLSQRLIDLLDKAKPQNPKSKSQSLWAALKSAVHESEKTTLENMLNNCRDQLGVRLIALTRCDPNIPCLRHPFCRYSLDH